MAFLKISSPNSSNFTEDEIENFSKDLSEELPPDFQIEKVRKEEKGYGVIYWELLQVWISDVPAEIRGVIIAKILEKGIEVIKKSFKRKDKRKGRPNAIVIYDEKGNEIETRVISDSRQKPRTKEEFDKWIEKRIKQKKKNKAKKKK